jgi:hypothetical protein
MCSRLVRSVVSRTHSNFTAAWSDKLQQVLNTGHPTSLLASDPLQGDKTFPASTYPGASYTRSVSRRFVLLRPRNRFVESLRWWARDVTESVAAVSWQSNAPITPSTIASLSSVILRHTHLALTLLSRSASLPTCKPLLLPMLTTMPTPLACLT